MKIFSPMLSWNRLRRTHLCIAIGAITCIMLGVGSTGTVLAQTTYNGSDDQEAALSELQNQRNALNGRFGTLLTRIQQHGSQREQEVRISQSSMNFGFEVNLDTFRSTGDIARREESLDRLREILRIRTDFIDSVNRDLDAELAELSRQLNGWLAERLSVNQRFSEVLARMPDNHPRRAEVETSRQTMNTDFDATAEQFRGTQDVPQKRNLLLVLGSMLSGRINFLDEIEQQLTEEANNPLIATFRALLREREIVNADLNALLGRLQPDDTRRIFVAASQRALYADARFNIETFRVDADQQRSINDFHALLAEKRTYVNSLREQLDREQERANRYATQASRRSELVVHEGEVNELFDELIRRMLLADHPNREEVRHSKINMGIVIQEYEARFQAERGLTDESLDERDRILRHIENILRAQTEYIQGWNDRLAQDENDSWQPEDLRARRDILVQKYIDVMSQPDYGDDVIFTIQNDLEGTREEFREETERQITEYESLISAHDQRYVVILAQFDATLASFDQALDQALATILNRQAELLVQRREAADSRMQDLFAKVDLIIAHPLNRRKDYWRDQKVFIENNLVQNFESLSDTYENLEEFIKTHLHPQEIVIQSVVEQLAELQAGKPVRELYTDANGVSRPMYTFNFPQSNQNFSVTVGNQTVTLPGGASAAPVDANGRVISNGLYLLQRSNNPSSSVFLFTHLSVSYGAYNFEPSAYGRSIERYLSDEAQFINIAKEFKAYLSWVKNRPDGHEYRYYLKIANEKLNKLIDVKQSLAVSLNTLTKVQQNLQIDRVEKVVENASEVLEILRALAENRTVAGAEAIVVPSFTD